MFILSNLYSFIIQNSFIEEEGNNFLSINAIFSIFDFLYFIFEFIIIDLTKVNNNNILNIISFIISLLVEIFLLILIIILLASFFRCKCVNQKKIEKFLKYL